MCKQQLLHLYLTTMSVSCCQLLRHVLDCARITFNRTVIIIYCLQVALVAGTTFTVVEIFAGVLFLATRDDNNNGYCPSSKMVILHIFMRGTNCQHTEQFCVLLWMHIVLACMPTGCVNCSFAEIDESKADATVNFGVYLSCLGSYKCLDGLPRHILGTALWFSPNNCNSAMTQQHVEDASLFFQPYVALCCIVCALLIRTISLVLIFQNIVSQWCRAATIPLYVAFGHQCNHQLCASEGPGPHCKNWSNLANVRWVPVEFHVRAQHRFGRSAFCLYTLCSAATMPHVTLNNVAYAVVILQT